MSTREPCPGCGGSGQISYFKGVSRFLLSWEECPECAGLGFRLEQPAPDHDRNPGNQPKKMLRAKKKKL